MTGLMVENQASGKSEREDERERKVKRGEGRRGITIGAKRSERKGAGLQITL